MIDPLQSNPINMYAKAATDRTMVGGIAASPFIARQI
jgi:hypothetical protein